MTIVTAEQAKAALSLAIKLKDGVPFIGVENGVDMYRVHDASDTMDEGADAIFRLCATVVAQADRIAELEAWISREADQRGDADAGYPADRQCAPILAARSQGGAE